MRGSRSLGCEGILNHAAERHSRMKYGEATMDQDPDNAIGVELELLRAEVKRLNEQRYFRYESSFFWVAVWSLARGLFFGLGSALGATILLAFLVRMLGSIDFIPILGDWANQIIEQIQTNSPQ